MKPNLLKIALLLNHPRKIKPSPGHKFFGFFTDTYHPHDNWSDPGFVQDMLDQVYNMYDKLAPYVLGYDTDEDFSLVVEVPDDFDFDAAMDDGWEIEDTSKVIPIDPNKDIGKIWWDNYAIFAYPGDEVVTVDPDQAKAEDIYKALNFQGN